MRLIYLDYNATTPIAPGAQQAMLPFLAEQYGNPSSAHALGRAGHEAIAQARLHVARLLGASADEILFTGGGTEANNLAIKGVAFRRSKLRQGHFVISSVEHPAIVEPVRFLERLGYAVTVVGTDPRGVVDVQQVADAIRPDTLLVSVMHANNEIGALQPIRQIGQICRSLGVLLHTDAAQSVGKVPTLVDQLGVDLLTVAGHKVYAPKGVGALYIRRGTVLEPLLHGAGHEGGLRAGTENVASIVALGESCRLANVSLDASRERLRTLRDRLQHALCDAINPKPVVHAAAADRLPNTLSIGFHAVIGADLLRRVPELCASTGSACHAGTTHMSSTLASIGLTPEIARGTVRLSLGWYTTEEEVDRAADLLIEAWEACR